MPGGNHFCNLTFASIVKKHKLNKSFQAEKNGLVMVNFFSYFLTCSNHSTLNDVISKTRIVVQ